MKRLATDQAVPMPGTKLADKMVYANNGLTLRLTNNHCLQKLGLENI